MSTQAVPHDERPGLQAQAPAEQTWVRPQVFPQSPQLAGSVVTSRQVPPQVFAVLGQAHTPDTQARLPQSLPHPPQLLGSFVGSTQRPPQVIAPVVQAHLPEMHALAAPQALPHAPQLVVSAERSLHPPLQFTRPAGQLDEQTPAPHT